MSAPASTAMPAFSYAQAARGLAPTKDRDVPTEQASKPGPKPESNASQPPSRSSQSRGRADEKETETATKAASTSSSIAEDTAEKENVPPKRPSQQLSEATPSSATSPNLTGTIGSPREKDLTQQLDRSESWEKASHTSTMGDKEPATAHKEKAKETEDDWEKVSVPSVNSEKEKDKGTELKPAPPPPINIWAARQQAQEAKLREVQNQRTAAASQSAPPSAAARPKPSTEASKSKSGAKDASEKEGTTGSRRSLESSRGNDMTSSQTIRPASQHGDKDEGAAAPTVNDVTSWPTPENAIVDDRRKSGPQDKAEGRSNGSKAHGKQWVTMPFVPTAKFETQLPPAAARRGARSGRGQGMSRGAHASNASNTGDRQDTGNTMPPPPLPRQAADQDRGRKPDTGHGGRSSSLPTGNRRATSRESTMTSTRKPSGKDNTALPNATPLAAPDTDPTHDQRTSNFSSHTPSRSSSRHEGPSTATALNGDLTTQITAETVADPFTISANEANIRSNYLPDRSKPTHSSFRSSGDPARERGPPRNRDYSREKSDAAREKVESWRDREYSGETSYRRESRPERGRGSYRGRGNHSASYQSSHANTSPLPQNGFENPKTPSGQESRSRQSSQPFMMGTQPPSNRGIPRSQSIPVGTMYPGYYNNAPGVPQALSPLQTDMSAYGYPPQMQMQPSIMSAMPYNDPLNSYAVLSMVMTQVEYYFSIDNLCKDLYLRKNMDTQGWVPLSIIANFKRIKTLTDDAMPIETLRHVCQQVKSVECSRGEDGKDRLRRREGWEDFVLEMHERFPAAQNDGPIIPPPPQHMPMIPAMVSGEGMPFVPQQVRSPSAAVPVMNGFYNLSQASAYGPVPSLDGHAGDQSFQDPVTHQMQDQGRRESTTSPLSQAERGIRQPMPFSPNHRPSGGMINGHRRQVSRNFNEENVFPDDAIASINICVREPPPDLADEDQSAKPALNRILSNESHGSNADVPPVNIPPRVSGLRGGAASPEQLARLQGMKFGFSSSQAVATDAPAFYSKEGEQTQMPPVKPGQYFVSYNALHESSLQQREQGIEGAMKPMYSFWANFLVDKFNNGMYSEFKKLAEGDLKEGDAAGSEHLLSYYRGALKSSAALSEHVALDLVTSLREEKDVGRPFFKMMRMAWRDGALNLKTRKRIGDLLRDEEKSEFDRGG